ncbi:MAG: DNA recombination protein RmuC [Proteobacteria bacterium]|nr:DNA recombination protein RmuC [Pseudomonadota bacterium]
MESILIFILGLALGFGAALLMQKISRAQAKDTFRALSAEALRANNDQFLDLAKNVLAREQEGVRHDLEKRTQHMTDVLKPFQEKLDKLDTHNREMEKLRAGAYEGLREHLSSLVQVQQQLRQETTQLKQALRRPEGRGRWGEMQLRRVMEMAGMMEHCDFIEQVSETGDNSRLRPDVVVKIPGGRQIVIDCKTPLDALLDIAETDEALAQNRERHAAALREHIKKLSAKTYWQQFEMTPDFVVLFMPGEHFLSVALQQQPELFDFAFESRVILATPLNLIALLRTVERAWRQERQAEHARVIARLGKELFETLHVFTDHFRKVGEALGRSVKSYNEAVGTFESRALTRARKLGEYGIQMEKEMDVLEPLEIVTRPLSLPASEGEEDEAELPCISRKGAG